MTDNQIIEAYDSNPNMTLAQLSAMSNKPISYLKEVLNAG